MTLALTEEQWAWLKYVAGAPIENKNLPDEIERRLLALGLIELTADGAHSLTATGRTILATVAPRKRVRRESAIRGNKRARNSE